MSSASPFCESSSIWCPHTPLTFNSAVIRRWFADQPASLGRLVRPENAPIIHSHGHHNPSDVTALVYAYKYGSSLATAEGSKEQWTQTREVRRSEIDVLSDEGYVEVNSALEDNATTPYSTRLGRQYRSTQLPLVAFSAIRVLDNVPSSSYINALADHPVILHRLKHPLHTIREDQVEAGNESGRDIQRLATAE
jgi:hypothetical protein